MKDEVINNRRHQVYTCKACKKHVSVWITNQIPNLIYCDPCAYRLIDEDLDRYFTAEKMKETPC